VVVFWLFENDFGGGLYWPNKKKHTRVIIIIVVSSAVDEEAKFVHKRQAQSAKHILFNHQ
jgi:hypothetical protein